MSSSEGDDLFSVPVEYTRSVAKDETDAEEESDKDERCETETEGWAGRVGARELMAESEERRLGPPKSREL